MTTNHCKYVEHITAILQEFVAHTETTNLKSSVQSFSGWFLRMTTNYRKYVEHINVILQEFVAHTGTTNLKSSVTLPVFYCTCTLFLVMAGKRPKASCGDGASPDIYGIQNIS